MTNEDKNTILALVEDMIGDRPSELHFKASDDGETVLWETVRKGKWKIGQFEAQQKQNMA